MKLLGEGSNRQASARIPAVACLISWLSVPGVLVELFLLWFPRFSPCVGLLR